MTRNDDGAPRALRDAPASHADDYEVVHELHAVPPHAVYGVRLEGRRAVRKLARGPEADPATEAAVLARVARETSVSVPEILAVGIDHFVAAWHDGVPDDPTLTEARARARNPVFEIRGTYSSRPDLNGVSMNRSLRDGQFTQALGVPRGHFQANRTMRTRRTTWTTIA